MCERSVTQAFQLNRDLLARFPVVLQVPCNDISGVGMLFSSFQVRETHLPFDSQHARLQWQHIDGEVGTLHRANSWN